MRTYRWAGIAVWLLLGWGMAARGGFTFSFLFYSYSMIAIYGWAVRWFGLSGVRMTRRLLHLDGGLANSNTFTAGEEVIVEVTLRRPVAWPVPWLVIRESIGNAEHDRLHGPWFSTRAVYQYVLPLPERGVYRFEPAELWAGDPFGIVQQRVFVRTGQIEVTVAPQPRMFGYESEKRLLSLGQGRRGPRERGDDERSEYRAYRDGDPLSRVLWKVAARTGDWYVRTHERTSYGEETAVVIDRVSLEASELDCCAEAAAGVIVTLGSHRRPFQLLATGEAGEAGAKDWRRTLAALSPISLDAAAVHQGALPSRVEAVILVCAALRPEMAALCREWQAGGREVLVLLVHEDAAAGLLPEEWPSWLQRGGIGLIELYPKRERVVTEGGSPHGAERYSYPS